MLSGLTEIIITAITKEPATIRGDYRKGQILVVTHLRVQLPGVALDEEVIACLLNLKRQNNQSDLGKK
jgi:hypothetical protein